MPRLFAALSLAAALLGGAACRKDPDLQPMHPKPGDLPPLPPASGTAVGYLLDAQTTLQLRDDQVAKLKEIDASLAAQNDVIDTQLREIEKPEEEQHDPKEEPRPVNHAPGVNTRTTPDAQKLHAARKSNDRAALAKVFAILDPKQQDEARKILAERGVEAPGATKPVAKEDDDDSSDGQPLPPGEP